MYLRIAIIYPDWLINCNFIKNLSLWTMTCLSNFENFLDLFGDGEFFSVSSELKIES